MVVCHWLEICLGLIWLGEYWVEHMVYILKGVSLVAVMMNMILNGFRRILESGLV